MKGNATSGDTFDLLEAVEAADTYIENVGQNAPAVEEKLEAIQAVVVDGEAAGDDLSKYFSDSTTDLENLMT